VSVEFGSIGAALAGEARVSQGYAGLIVAREATVEQALVRTMIAQRVTINRPSAVLILIAQRVDGSVRPLLDWRGALAAGLGVAAITAVARVAGETAPLLFTSSIAANQISTDVTNALPTLPVSIFVFSESPDPNEQAMGWAAALVLILFVLVLNIVAKVVAGRQRRKHEGA